MDYPKEYDRVVEQSNNQQIQLEQLEAAVQAEKQEPVEDEPVARKIKYGSLVFLEGYHELPDGTLLYARPQPDLTAEVERLREELRIYHDADAKAAAQIHQQAQRIAELDAVLGNT